MTKRLEKLRGCFNGTGITSTNYKDEVHWISVQDRLPDKNNHKEVLTFEIIINIKTKKKIKCICLEETESIHKDENGIYSDGGGENITHWMPLPQPPKEYHEMD